MAEKRRSKSPAPLRDATPEKPTTPRTQKSEPPPPPRLLRWRQVAAQTGLCRASIYQLMQRGEFPQSIPIGSKSVAWIESQVIEWNEQQIAAADEVRAQRLAVRATWKPRKPKTKRVRPAVEEEPKKKRGRPRKNPIDMDIEHVT